ncbi:hypothetical protein C1645_820422 [Glomus cerebriforme]|uniref:Uncharacterized protein n=1 Tax=Glomus cerebriforme TaxID=658196 RepID=A0A397T708_9GLOM|nr:hypothetical protein C1645_820422 [Glomus cerebriforme]
MSVCFAVLRICLHKDNFALIWANDDVNKFLFGKIKPPNNSTSINKSIIKLAKFMKGSLDLIINRCGYVDNLETYGVLIHGSEIKIFSMDLTFNSLYHYNQLSKILLPTENANFLNIITVISTFYFLLERIKSTIVTMNSSQPSSFSGHLYCRKLNSSPKKIHGAMRLSSKDLIKTYWDCLYFKVKIEDELTPPSLPPKPIALIGSLEKYPM